MPSVVPPSMIGNKWDCVVTVHRRWPVVKCVRDDDVVLIEGFLGYELNLINLPRTIPRAYFRHLIFWSV